VDRTRRCADQRAGFVWSFACGATRALAPRTGRTVMTLALVALAAAAIYLGTIQASFSALMRLSLRILAERSDRPDGLGGYLGEPLQLFIPLWLLLGLITTTATALLAWTIGAGAPHNVALVIFAAAAFVLVCELGVPVALSARDPERMLGLLLPWFSPVAR